MNIWHLVTWRIYTLGTDHKEGRKNAVYTIWMSSSWEECGKPEMPPYLIRDLPRDMALFRTSYHYLKVETDRWKRPIFPWNYRVCFVCDSGTVQDRRVVFECNEEALLNSRRRYLNLIFQSESKMIPLQYLMCNPEVEGWAKLSLFIHECMKRLDQVFFA